uniref:Uncharacterized protein n=1 Tax=Aegilops tauschii subsp. strangulata TaxID=200361 RepID=A0A453JGG8_AEGTS
SKDCGAQHGNHRAFGHRNYPPPKLDRQSARSSSSNTNGWSSGPQHPICSVSTCHNQPHYQFLAICSAVPMTVLMHCEFLTTMIHE